MVSTKLLLAIAPGYPLTVKGKTKPLLICQNYFINIYKEFSPLQPILTLLPSEKIADIEFL